MYSGILEEEEAYGSTASTLLCILVTLAAFEPRHQARLGFDPIETWKFCFYMLHDSFMTSVVPAV